MRILTRIALAAAAAAFAASIGAASAEDKVLKIGTEGAYPPFNNLTADGKLEGFDIDIAKALCDEMKVKCEFVTQVWTAIIPGLKPGKSARTAPRWRLPRSARRRSTSPTSTI